MTELTELAPTAGQPALCHFCHDFSSNSLNRCHGPAVAASPEPTTATALQQALGPVVGVFEANAGEVAVGLPYLKRIELSADSALVTVRNDGTAPLAPRLELQFFNQYGMQLRRTNASFEADPVPPGGVRAKQIAISLPNLADIFATSTVTLPNDWTTIRFVAVRRVATAVQPTTAKNSGHQGEPPEADGTIGIGSSLAQRLENARTTPQPTIDPRRPPSRAQLVKRVQPRPGILVDNKLSSYNIGPTAIDAKWSNYGAYLQRVIEVVQLQWERIIIIEQKANPAAGSLVTVKFVINDGGRIVDIGVVESSANETATRAAGRGAQMRIVERIGVLLFADSAPEPKPLPDDIAITGIKRTAQGLDISVKNPSPYMRLASSASISLTPLSGGETKKIPLRSFRLLPESSQEIAVELPADIAGLGRASVLAVIDYGAQDLVVGEARLTF